MAKIVPTIGRVVWYHEANFNQGQPCAAIVAFVHSDSMVNLAVFDPSGKQLSRTSVPLIQDGDERPDWGYCEWMPYQKGQAAKTAELEKQVAGN